MGARGLLVGVVAGVALAACSAPLVTTPAAPAAPTCPLEGCTAGAWAGQGAVALCPSAGDRACAGMVAEACTEKALAAWGGADDDRALGCVARMLSEACDAGDARACGFAGRFWLDGRGAPRDAARGLRMLGRACDGGVALACLVGAKAVGDASGAPDAPDFQHRFEMEYACLEGQAETCFQVGLFFHLGQEGFPRDLVSAVQAYVRGCNLGESRACNNLGDALAYGEGIERDLDRAADSFTRACKLGEALGCANLAYRLEHGSGVVRDLARARALYRDACNTGSVYACLHAELLALQEALARRDPAGELAHWVRACDRGKDGRACAFVGLLYDDGPDGLHRDEGKSLHAMRRGCELGEPRACDWVRMHTEE